MPIGSSRTLFQTTTSALTKLAKALVVSIALMAVTHVLLYVTLPSEALLLQHSLAAWLIYRFFLLRSR